MLIDIWTETKASWGREPASDRFCQVQIRLTGLMLTVPAVVSFRTERVNIQYTSNVSDHI